MPAAGHTSPIRPETYENLQLNAGIFLINFDTTAYTTASALKAALVSAIEEGTKILGATRGGGQFVVNSTIREPDVDGARYRFVGGAFVDDVDARLTTTLLEITPGNFQRVLATGEVTTDGNRTTVTMHTQIQDTDYIPNFVWVGDLADGRFVAITLKNALNENGMNFTFTDKGEGTMPVEFHAYQSNVNDYDYAPFQVDFLDDPATPAPATPADSATPGSTP